MNEDRKVFGKSVDIWWRQLQKDNGGLARIRRQSDVLGIESTDCFYDLVAAAGNVKTDDLACIAMAVCHVDIDSEAPVARIMGGVKQNSDHAVSELRFNKLISLNLQEVSRELVRVLPLVNSTANVAELANDLRYWDSEKQISKKKWLNEYYTANRRE